MAVKQKRSGLGLEVRTFNGRDGQHYIVFRDTGGSYHVFLEVEAKEAARQCGAPVETDTRHMWAKLWRAPEPA